MRSTAVIFFCLWSFALGAEELKTITPAEVKDHMGETVKLRGTVDEVKTTKTGTTFLDMGGKFPHQAFTVFIRSGMRPGPVWEELQGKTIMVTGTISLYKGKPQIALTSSDQLAVEP